MPKLKHAMPQTREELAERVRPLASRLVDKLVDVMVQQVEDNLARLTEKFEETVMSVGGDIIETIPRMRTVPRKQLAAKTARNGTSDGKRRNHCGKCGAEGFQTKTCGKTHNANGPIARPRPPTSKAKTSAKDDDDDEEAAKPAAVAAPRFWPKPTPAIEEDAEDEDEKRAVAAPPVPAIKRPTADAIARHRAQMQKQTHGEDDEEDEDDEEEAKPAHVVRSAPIAVQLKPRPLPTPKPPLRVVTTSPVAPKPSPPPKPVPRGKKTPHELRIEAIRKRAAKLDPDAPSSRRGGPTKDLKAQIAGDDEEFEPATLTEDEAVMLDMAQSD